MPTADNCLTLGLALWPSASAAGSAAACVLKTEYGVRRNKNSLYFFKPPGTTKTHTHTQNKVSLCMEIWINNKYIF